MGTTLTDAAIQAMPKVELHVHVEGTLEPELSFELAQRNGVQLPVATPEELVAAYDFHDLPSFLTIYYAAMEVLQQPDDFRDLALAYFRKAAQENVRYVEMFFDPQAHTVRGVAFETVLEGLREAQRLARAELDLRAELILCFLRDHSAESAAATLEQALPYADQLLGVGLDSDEANNPPRKFAEVFARARAAGLKLTMHCDVNQTDTHANLRECLDLIQVDRIDHGVNCLEVPELAEEIRSRGLGLTVCPVSNRFVVQSLTGDEIRRMLELGIKATINSDDPAYFRAYMNENLRALRDDCGFTGAELTQLMRNAVDVCWIDEAGRGQLYGELATWAAASGA